MFPFCAWYFEPVGVLSEFLVFADFVLRSSSAKSNSWPDCVQINRLGCECGCKSDCHHTWIQVCLFDNYSHAISVLKEPCWTDCLHGYRWKRMGLFFSHADKWMFIKVSKCFDYVRMFSLGHNKLGSHILELCIVVLTSVICHQQSILGYWRNCHLINCSIILCV